MGSPGVGSPTSPVLCRGSDVSPPRVASLPSLGGAILTPLPSLPARMGVTRPGPGPFLQRRPSTASPGWRARDLPGSWGTPLCTCPALRPRRTPRPWPRRAVRCCLPLRKRRRLRNQFPFEAQSRGLHTPCVRFAAGVAPGPRNTRFRLVPTLCRDRISTCWVPLESFRHVVRATWLPLSPGFTWRNSRGNVATPGVRCRHGAHASRAGGRGARCRPQDADHPTCHPARPHGPRPSRRPELADAARSNARWR